MHCSHLSSTVVLTFFLVSRHELTEDEKENILQSDSFRSFFDQTSRVIEQALTEHVDIFFDYSGRNLDDKEGWVMSSLQFNWFIVAL